MAIPIKNYIDIATRTVGGTVEDRDFSGLVITKNEMKTTVPSAYTDIKTNYNAGEAVSLTLDDITACFDSGDLLTYATKYFSYNGGNRKPSVLNVALVLSEDDVYENPVTTFNRVAAETINWGTCTVLGVMGASAGSDVDFTYAQIAAVATANDALDAQNVFIVCAQSSNVSAVSGVAKIGGGTLFDDLEFTHIVVGNDKYGAWMPMAWYASVNYDLSNASASIDYKQFSGETAVVTTQTDKTQYDAGHLNYVGKVQVYGTGLSFYQQGENMDGTDLGVVRDSAWIKGLITVDYFNLQSSVQKLPANHVGAAMVRNIIVGAATKGIENGAILLDKPIDDTLAATINEYAGDDTAAAIVAATGYFVAVDIVKNGTRYICQYTLIYAKGDHIGKVEGQHVLV